MEIFDYDNILLLPRKCRVDSRSECDASVEFGGRRFALPVVPANMKTAIDGPISEMLAASGYFYVMHRFDLDSVAYARRMRDKGLFVSLSSCVKPADYAVIDRLAADGVGADYITIDIAHGHAESVRLAIEHMRKKLPKAFIIAGNVATPEAVIDLENWGADATKVGVGPGKVCITKLKTGFGTGGWQLSALKWCARVATKPIIADGGIRHHGDIAKSVRFGAAMVMVGSLFAGHEESPGATVQVDGKRYKEYYGSASDFKKGEYKHVEGKRILEPIKGVRADTLREMREDVQSSISYAGGRVLADLKKVNYVILGCENAGEHLFMTRRRASPLSTAMPASHIAQIDGSGTGASCAPVERKLLPYWMSQALSPQSKKSRPATSAAVTPLPTRKLTSPSRKIEPLTAKASRWMTPPMDWISRSSTPPGSKEKLPSMVIVPGLLPGLNTAVPGPPPTKTSLLIMPLPCSTPPSNSNLPPLLDSSPLTVSTPSWLVKSLTSTRWLASMMNCP